MIENLELSRELENKLEGITELNDEAVHRIIIVGKEYGVSEDKIRLFLDNLQRKDSAASEITCSGFILLIIAFLISEIEIVNRFD